jgi:hypothetical protein
MEPSPSMASPEAPRPTNMYVDGQWETTPAPSSAGIGKIVMVSATEGWAAVEGGAAAGLLHYQNGRWTAVPS